MMRYFTNTYLGAFIYGAFVWLCFLSGDHVLTAGEYLGFFLGFFISALALSWARGREYDEHNR